MVRRNNRFALLGAPAFTFRARATLGGAPAAAAPPFHYARVRIWVLAAIVLAPTVLIWVIDIRAARRDRRARLNHCPKCNYDRTGLAAGAVCPECGQARPTS